MYILSIVVSDTSEHCMDSNPDLKYAQWIHCHTDIIITLQLSHDCQISATVTHHELKDH